VGLALVHIDTASIGLLCIAAFAASIIDAMVGGGGLISLPALFIAIPTAPPPALLATNKFSSTFGAAAAVGRYTLSRKVPWRVVFWPAVFGLIASVLGAYAVTRMDPLVLRPLVLILLVAVFIVTLVKKDLGAERKETRRPAALGMIAGGVIGFYEGFFGPGTGSFLLFMYVVLYGFSFLKASAAGRVINFAANLGALGLFIAKGLVIYEVAVPMAGCTIAGGILGSHLAITQGSRWIRIVFMVVVIAVIGKFAYDIMVG
jgi:uncharacterized protein